MIQLIVIICKCLNDALQEVVVDVIPEPVLAECTKDFVKASSGLDHCGDCVTPIFGIGGGVHCDEKRLDIVDIDLSVL